MDKTNILDVFYGSLELKPNVIQTVEINDKNTHKNGLVNLLLNIENQYIIDKFNKDILNKLFHYFIGDIEFCQKNDIDLNKGIFLVGGVGTGKSILIQAFKQYTGLIIEKNSFQYFNSNEIIDTTNIQGVTYLERFGDLKHQTIACYIDDIASKNETVKNFGTEINVIENILITRYNIFKKYNKLTHLSSNIYPNELNKMYDLRVVDRLLEMCNIFELTGNSRRK